MSSLVKWTLISGAGNRFFVTFLNHPPPASDSRWGGLVPSLCGRSVKDLRFFYSSPDKKDSRLIYEGEKVLKGNQALFGGGNHRPLAHGVVVLYPSVKGDVDLKWLFWNSDGSVAEMCGNAACCVVEYAAREKLVPSHKTSFVIQTPYQSFRGEWGDGQARVVLKQNFVLTGPFPFEFSPAGEKRKEGLNPSSVSYHFVNTGVPHAVIKREPFLFDGDLSSFTNLGRVLRRQTLHHPRGMNVSFYCETDKKGVLRAMTFERGVEGLTPACGTGALAVVRSYVQSHRDMEGEVIDVDMPGGRLSVCLSENEVWLSSPVQWAGWLEEKNLFP